MCAPNHQVNAVGENLTEGTKLNLFKKLWNQIDFFFKSHYIELNIDSKSRDQKVIKSFIIYLIIINIKFFEVYLF